MGLFGRSEKYTVQPGDSLESIAAQFGAKPEAILKKNKLQSAADIQPGQQIKVTKGSGSSSSSD